ncbi:unnamed protein product [Gongylonema pulchrum]|uniref:Protein sleepless n=1 Tax=Gongylonema pulchrum TaxID=637853 RepID=A0A183CYQ0_9BILA|nr:unnamed protein product [Gongylonema pulchrum]
MFVRDADVLLLAAISSFTFPEGAISLECYICGDDNLDEHGECQAQFHLALANTEIEKYKSNNYYADFKITGSYTIMKECISETDHYRIFPLKQYAVTEECDLTDVSGEELAYCLCSQDLCNAKDIVDQFIDFEEVLFIY